MELNLPEYRLLSPSSSEPLSRIDVFLYATMAGAKCFQKLQNYVSGKNITAKIGDFCLLVSTFSRLEQSFGQIVVTMKVPF